MSSFNSIEFYNPLIVLLTGLITFFGYLGFGLLLLKICRIGLESPWRHVAGVLLGTLTASLLVQAVAMGGIATRTVLTCLWVFVVSAGLLTFIRLEIWRQKISFPLPRRWDLLPFSLLLAALAANLLAAIAPSSKIDELYYHMVLPSRIVNDGALKFYMMPWEGAVLPHMLFQIALTPLHAMNYPDAGNIVSWGLSAMLAWFGWRLLNKEHGLNGWSYLALACLVTGMYPVIWDVTNGSYAMGDLATAAAVVALLSYNGLIAKAGVYKYAFLTSFLVLCAGSSKVSLLPPGLAIILILFFFIFRNAKIRKNSWAKLILSAAAPWIILYLPILTWTFLHSGSPFGPVFPGFLDSGSVYNPEIIRGIMHADRQTNQPAFYTVAVNVLIYFPVLLWIGIFLFFKDRQIPIQVRLAGFFLIVLQTLVLCFRINFDPRFYGGLLQGILIIWLISGERNGWNQAGRIRNRAASASFILLLPWLALQVFYASRFFPVALGFQPKMEFYHRKIAFMKDYLALDKILPADAVLLVTGGSSVRMNINFAPRPVYLSMDKPPEGKRCFIFNIDQDKPMMANGYKTGSIVYRNDHSVTITYRNPFRLPVTGRLSVYATEPVITSSQLK